MVPSTGTGNWMMGVHHDEHLGRLLPAEVGASLVRDCANDRARYD